MPFVDETSVYTSLRLFFANIEGFECYWDIATVGLPSRDVPTHSDDGPGTWMTTFGPAKATRLRA